ncbi:hypothetical protein M405DRAFT_58718 [Rhizopogon salebrosus TDB-379]|nr:hypothetical protein M405DRAFT_58718 [Rhizopogon salebrosus TDB-379]
MLAEAERHFGIRKQETYSSGNSSETTTVAKFTAQAMHDRPDTATPFPPLNPPHGELFSGTRTVMRRARQGRFKSSFIGLTSIWIIIGVYYSCAGARSVTGLRISTICICCGL